MGYHLVIDLRKAMRNMEKYQICTSLYDLYESVPLYKLSLP